jgi:hypothetical protein
MLALLALFCPTRVGHGLSSSVAAILLMWGISMSRGMRHVSPLPNLIMQRWRVCRLASSHPRGPL